MYLDKSQYKLGEELIYEVSLENITNDVLIFPWSPDPVQTTSDGKSEFPEYEGFLYLVMKDEALGNVILGAQGLYGSPSFPDSIKKLQPREKVRIRVPAYWSFLHGDITDHLSPKLPKRVEVRAEFRLIGEGFKPALSANSIGVALKNKTQ